MLNKITITFGALFISFAAQAQYAFYNQTCTDTTLSNLQSIGKPQACTAVVSPSSMPSAFAGVSVDMMAKQDETPQNYSDYDDFKDQLTRFTQLDKTSKDTACSWLFWSNGVMRRPYSGTLCAIAKYSGYIKQMANKYGVPPEYIACAIGGDSMIVGGSPDYIAKNKSGTRQNASEYILDLVQSQAFDSKYPSFSFSSNGTVEKLIEKMAVIGQEAKQKYLRIYGSSDLNFGKGPEHEAAVLATIYNKGVERCNPSPPRTPTFNYFGLSCARMMKVYKLHLNGNPSADACN